MKLGLIVFGGLICITSCNTNINAQTIHAPYQKWGVLKSEKIEVIGTTHYWLEHKGGKKSTHLNSSAKNYEQYIGKYCQYQLTVPLEPPRDFRTVLKVIKCNK